MDPEGGQGVQTPPPPPPPTGIARLLVFAMLKFSVRPLLGIWTPLRKFSGSGHVSRLCTCNQQPPHPGGIAGTLTFSPANSLLKAPPSGDPVVNGTTAAIITACYLFISQPFLVKANLWYFPHMAVAKLRSKSHSFPRQWGWLQMTSILKPEYILMTLSQRICIVEINTRWHCEKKLTKLISFHRLSGTEFFQPSDKHIPLSACQRFFYSSLVLFICLGLCYMYFLKDAL